MLSERASARESSSASTVTSPCRPSRTAGSCQNYGSRRTSHGHRPSISYRNDQFGRQLLQTKFENTYRMEPDDKDRFQPGVVEKMLGSVLESFLDGELYQAFRCAQIAQNLTDVIKGRVKELSLPRYKFVSHVMIGQSTGQSVSFASRSVWNTSTDNFASATYRNGSLFAVATVFATYFE